MKKPVMHSIQSFELHFLQFKLQASQDSSSTLNPTRHLQELDSKLKPSSHFKHFSSSSQVKQLGTWQDLQEKS
jgi:hypothetical protein